MGKNKGVTLVELLLAVTMSIFLYAVIAVYLTQVQKLSHRALHSQELLSEELGALGVIMQDLRSATRTSVGNWVLNGDFEDEDASNSKNPPRFWDDKITGAGTYEYLLTDSPLLVHNGYRSICLQGLSNSAPTYDSTEFITLSAGVAYMFSAWVRSSALNTPAKVSLIDSGGTPYVSSQPTTSTIWQQILVRVPTTGTYAGGVSNDQVKVRLTLVSGPGLVYFDDISFSPIQAVFVSTNSAEVNVSAVIGDMADPSDGVGFHFLKCDGGVPTIYRYRMGLNNGVNYLVREKFDKTATQWEPVGTSRLALGICILKIFYDPNNALPPSGKDSPLNILFGVTDTYSKNQNLKVRVETVAINPITP